MRCIAVVQCQIVGVLQPMSRLQHDGATELWKSAHLLYQSLTWSKSTHYLWVILRFHRSPLPTVLIKYSTLHVFLSYFFFSPCIKPQLKSVLQNQCHPSHLRILKPARLRLPYRCSSRCCCEHLCSKAEGRSMVKSGGRLAVLWPLALVSLIIDA